MMFGVESTLHNSETEDFIINGMDTDRRLFSNLNIVKHRSQSRYRHQYNTSNISMSNTGTAAQPAADSASLMSRCCFQPQYSESRAVLQHQVVSPQMTRNYTAETEARHCLLIISPTLQSYHKCSGWSLECCWWWRHYLLSSVTPRLDCADILPDISPWSGWG